MNLSQDQKKLASILEKLEDRLLRRERAPVGMIYQAKKHRKIARLKHAIDMVKSMTEPA